MVFFDKLPFKGHQTFIVLLSSLALFACPFGEMQKVAFATSPAFSLSENSFSFWIETGVQYSKSINSVELQVGNMVSWSTKEETNNAYFVVQRSLDGITFKNVIQLKGAGTSTEENRYQWLDTRTGDMRVFYRLQQIGLDGNFYFSETIISTRITPNNLLVTAMSSPETDGLFTISLRSTVDANLYYAVMDRSRHTMREGEMSIVKGVNVLTIDITELENSQYQLVLEAGGEIEQVYLQKVHTDKMPPLAAIFKE